MKDDAVSPSHPSPNQTQSTSLFYLNKLEDSRVHGELNAAALSWDPRDKCRPTPATAHLGSLPLPPLRVWL